MRRGSLQYICLYLDICAASFLYYVAGKVCSGPFALARFLPSFLRPGDMHERERKDSNVCFEDRSTRSNKMDLQQQVLLSHLTDVTFSREHESLLNNSEERELDRDLYARRII